MRISRSVAGTHQVLREEPIRIRETAYSDGRQWQRYADFVAGFKHVCNVLEIGINPASGIEFPVQHQRRYGIEDCASGSHDWRK